MKSFKEINEGKKIEKRHLLDASLILQNVKDHAPDSFCHVDTESKEIIFRFPGHQLSYLDMDIPDEYDKKLSTSQSETLNNIEIKIEKAVTKEYENFLKKLSKIMQDGGDEIEKISPHLKTSLKFNL